MHGYGLTRTINNPRMHSVLASHKYFQKLKIQIIVQRGAVYFITLFLLRDDLYVTLNFKFSGTVEVFV